MRAGVAACMRWKTSGNRATPSAATKAGGIGTSLVVLGVLVAGGATRPLTGVLTIVFMLLTLSVASQLLARAAYISGAPLEGLDRGDPLAGVLDRDGRAPDEGTDVAIEDGESGSSLPDDGERGRMVT